MKFIKFDGPEASVILVDVERVSMIKAVQVGTPEHSKGFRSTLILEDGSGSNLSLEPYCEISVCDTVLEISEKLEATCPST